MWGLTFFKPEPLPPVGVHVPAKVAPQVAKVGKVDVKVSSVRVYKPEAKDKLTLPQEIKTNPTTHVVEAVLVTCKQNDQVVTTLIDETTGITTTLVRNEPPPTFRFKFTGDARADFGMIDTGKKVVQLSLRQDVFQSKRYYGGINLNAATDGRLFGGAGMGLRW